MTSLESIDIQLCSRRALFLTSENVFVQSSADFYAAQQDILVKSANIIVSEGAFLGGNALFPPVQVSLPGSNGASTSSSPAGVQQPVTA